MAGMLIAEWLDRKQGEKRVVDQPQLLRDHLDKWLKTRPPAADLVNRGIIGRDARFSAARDVIDVFLRRRAQASAEKAAQIPAGTVVYSPQLRTLLDGDAGDAAEQRSAGGSGARAALEARLATVRAERGAASRRLEAASQDWSTAAAAARRAVCGSDALRGAAAGVRSAAEELEAHRTSTGRSLADVFSKIQTFQRLSARKACLERIVAVVEKTDAIREAVFACRDVDEAFFETLEEVIALCDALPSRSRSMAATRLQFLVGPLKATFLGELQEALQETAQWPKDGKVLRPAPEGGAAEAEVVRLCVAVQRLQRISRAAGRAAVGTQGAPREAQAEAGAVGASEEEELFLEAPWASTALAVPLLAKFRHFFWQPESDLCRMDKPEWAFKYLLNTCRDHRELLEKWVAEAGEGEAESLVIAGLALAMADEARLFIRARMPALCHHEARPVFLQTVHHLMRFQRDIGDMGGPVVGPAASRTVFADFDENRPLQDSSGSPADEAGPASPSQRASAPAPAADAEEGRATPAAASSVLMAGLSHLRSDAKGDAEPAQEQAPGAEASVQGQIGKVGAQFMAGLSRFRLGAASAAASNAEFGDRLLTGLSQFADEVAEEAVEFAEAEVEADESRPGRGFLDVWIEADAEFVSEKLSSSLAVEGATGAWKTRPLRLAAEDWAGSSASGMAGEPGGKAGAEVAELATLIADLFEKVKERAACLSTEKARGTYAAHVLGMGLLKAVEALRARWTSMKDPVQEPRQAALLLETLEEVCRFLDRFGLSEHFVGAVDESNALRLGMLNKLAEALLQLVRRESRRLHADACVFSFILAPPLGVLQERLRPSNFQLVARQSIVGIADFLLKGLLRRSSFASAEQRALYDANCRGDLGAVLAPLLSEADLSPLRPLWDACSLLALDDGEAAAILSALRHVAKCSPAAALRSLQERDSEGQRGQPAQPPDGAEEVPVVGEVLRQRRAEVFAAAGIQELPVPDAIDVLGKRPELAGALADLQEGSLGALLERLPTAAQAQATLQLGADVLGQLQAPLPTTTTVAAAAAAAGSVGEMAASKLRFQTLTVAELGSFLPTRRLISGMGQVATTLRPLGGAAKQQQQWQQQ